MINILKNIINQYGEGDRYEIYAFSTDTKTVHIFDKDESKFYKLTIEELIQKRF